MVVFDHPLATRQRIEDRVDVVVEQPLDSRATFFSGVPTKQNLSST